MEKDNTNGRLIAMIKRNILKLFLTLSYLADSAVIILLYPLNNILSIYWRNKAYPNSVLHISYMVHIPYYMVDVLRKNGVRADYMAIGTSPFWNKCDFNVIHSTMPFIRAFQEFIWFWKVVARYEIIQSHFIALLSESGWELSFLKRMGRKIIIHYRGCEIRERKINMKLHPDLNICEECDYYHKNEKKYFCELSPVIKKRILAEKYGDFFMVTTPDLLDFSSEAVYIPFFINEDERFSKQSDNKIKTTDFKIVHATNHPGIEGTRFIKKAVDSLRNKGYKIEFIFLNRVSYDEVLSHLSDADLSIGKMKMGYYANAQIESMMLGVPAITYVRPEFLTEELKKSGFIFTALDKLEETIEFYITNKEQLEQKKKIARDSICRIHNNSMIASSYIEIYSNMKRGFS